VIEFPTRERDGTPGCHKEMSRQVKGKGEENGKKILLKKEKNYLAGLLTKKTGGVEENRTEEQGGALQTKR